MISLISVLTGIFNRFIIFTIIIFIHELGHFLAGIILGWKVDKIYIYPYGGCTKFNNLMNTGMIEELIVLISGPLFQCLFYFILKNHFSINDYMIFRNYNYAILFFNLLPIYPLDGGRLLNLVISFFVPLKIGLKISLIISLIITFFLFFYFRSLSFYLVLLFLIIKIIEEVKNIKYYYNKFLLERYLYKFKFRRSKIINSIDSFYRSRSHIIKYNNRYYSEKEFLRNYNSM